MVYYIETPKPQKKAQQIIMRHGAVKLPERPISLKKLPKGRALIAVVQNTKFDAAMFVDNEQELMRIALDRSGRPVTFLLMERKLAEELTGWTPEGPDV
jgi:hypothetical protein